MEREERNPRKQAELILNWARRHIVNPCGDTPEERAFMKKIHKDVVSGALEESGIRETLTPKEQSELQGLLEG